MWLRAGSSQLENLATEFASYEDFLNSQIAPIDLYYLEVGMALYGVVWVHSARAVYVYACVEEREGYICDTSTACKRKVWLSRGRICNSLALNIRGAMGDLVGRGAGTATG